MPPKGIANTDEIIAMCNETQTVLGEAIEAEWKEILTSVAEILEGMKSKFFLKTNPAVPITNTIKRDATAVKDAAAAGDTQAMPDALEQLKSSMEKLLKAGKMEGIIIT